MTTDEKQNSDLTTEMLAIFNELVGSSLDWQLEATNGDKQDDTLMWERVKAATTKADLEEMTAILSEIMEGNLEWRLDALCGDLQHVDEMYGRIRAVIAKAKGQSNAREYYTKKQTIYVTKFWKTMGIIVTEGLVERWNGNKYAGAKVINPRDGRTFTDCFGSNAQEFWLSEEEAMNYIREQQDQEFERVRNSIWALTAWCDDDARLPIGRVVSLFDDIIPSRRKLPAVVRQGNVNNEEKMMATEPHNPEMPTFSHCEICGEAIMDSNESFYACSHVNADGYICRQCAITAIRKTYPEWARSNKNANDKE